MVFGWGKKASKEVPLAPQPSNQAPKLTRASTKDEIAQALLADPKARGGLLRAVHMHVLTHEEFRDDAKSSLKSCVLQRQTRSALAFPEVQEAVAAAGKDAMADPKVQAAIAAVAKDQASEIGQVLKDNVPAP